MADVLRSCRKYSDFLMCPNSMPLSSVLHSEHDDALHKR